MVGGRRNKGSVLVFLRKALLVYLLAMVALGAWLARARSTDWNNTLRVTVYPINGDGSVNAQRYMDKLDAGVFTAVEKFVVREGARYGMTLPAPLRIELAPQVDELPPAPPPSRGIVAVMSWSLKLRHYAWRQQRADGLPAPDIRMFVLYHDPETNPQLAHSLGLKEGLIGVVNAYASRSESARNNVVLAHEFLHTLGATDKYDPASNLPLFPAGYADPQASPRWPQTHAEVMAGRIPLSQGEAVMPERLKQTLVGPATAAEIGWVDEP